ncbi:hypothetical protein ANN_10447 [Periplaneta americana]|uniref:Uncharacterized protein n=1 Tax=Periplaneta americana TaxID=6978 RepID=A0ABQ8TQM8_PERAM|nr:hypothetical protein ANN_10447 [Periplaneta americana]
MAGLCKAGNEPPGSLKASLNLTSDINKAPLMRQCTLVYSTSWAACALTQRGCNPRHGFNGGRKLHLLYVQLLVYNHKPGNSLMFGDVNP